MVQALQEAQILRFPVAKNDLNTLSLENIAELHSFTSATNYTLSNTSAGICYSHRYLWSAYLSDFFGKKLWFKLIAHQHFKMLFL